MIRVDVDAIEVVQVIQAPGNPPYETDACPRLPPRSRGVPLIAGRQTFARVYVSNLSARREVRVRGVLSMKAAGAAVGHEVRSIGTVDWPARLPMTLASQRGMFAGSLNFELAPEFCVAGPEFEIEIVSIEDVHSAATVEIGSSVSARVRFQPSAALTCRALALHYRDDETGQSLAPTDTEVDLVRRYVSRTFPVAKIGWSTARVRADSRFQSLGPVDDYAPLQDEIASRMLSRLLLQLLAHRNQEIRAGWAEDTLYLGLISDPNGRFGGVAMDASPFPVTHTVAVSAVDDTGETAAHELAHLLGRHHPGIPDADTHGFELGQFEVDERARFEIGFQGHLSPGGHSPDPRTVHLGLDTSNAHGMPRVLAHDRYYDLMTYRYPQWVSAYTYRSLFDRLRAIESRPSTDGEGRRWTAICRFDLSRKRAQFVHVLESAFVTPQHPDGFDDVDEYAATRALDRVYWLHAVRRVFSRSQWSAIIEAVESVRNPGDAGTRSASTDDRDTPVVSIPEYNRIVGKLLAHSDPGIGRILRENNVPESLCDPSIRVYVEQLADDPAPDAGAMWRRAKAVYHRGVGDPARFPFGLFQFTLSGPRGETAPPRSATLMIDGIVVDRFEPALGRPDTDRVAEAIFAVLEATFGDGAAERASEPRGDGCARTSVTPRYPDPPGEPPGGLYVDPPAPNGLYYDVGAGGYYLHYEWPDTVVDAVSPIGRELVHPAGNLGAAVTTTIFCLSPCPSDGGGEQWEVAWVDNALYGRVWIAPSLFEYEYRGQRPCCPQRPLLPLPSRPVGARRDDTLTFRVEIAIGFETCSSRVFKAQPDILTPAKERFFEPIDARPRTASRAGDS